LSKTILIIGGYGVFGGKLADALSADPAFDVIVAGRSLSSAERFCEGKACRPLAVDTAAPDLAAALAGARPFIVVDASGPFQVRRDAPYRVAEAALACGAHYLDLSDDGAFTAGIDTLNDAAIERGLTVLSGVSSVPALSSAAVVQLAEGFTTIDHIESIILPGNRAPRGLSVVRAIVGQAGRPLPLWRAGRFESATGWSERRTITLDVPGEPPVRNRWASLIGAPDLTLFPDHFRARSVSFRAGLDLKLMHGGLALLSLPVRWGLIRSLSPLAPALKWMADRLEPFGSSTGGMRVSVSGCTDDGRTERRDWTLIVRGGDGPSIPAIPAEILCRRLAAGTVSPGARPCLGEFTLAEAEAALARLRTATAQTRQEIQFVFETVLGEAWSALPAEIQALHAIPHARRWTGRARIERGTGLISRLAGALAGFPPAGEDVPVTVEMTRRGTRETWVRTFGARRFRSYLSSAGRPGSGRIQERFGLMRFRIGLQVRAGRLEYPVLSGRFLGIPWPAFLLPRSTTAEFVDPEGRACFSVRIDLPLGGHVVSYSGWLLPDDAPPPAE
jgi:saccharopine dehydrogenase-like NADP-dependent oxidoreductase